MWFYLIIWTESEKPHFSQVTYDSYYQLAAREAHDRLVLRSLCTFRVCLYIYLCVRTYHVCNNYVTRIVAMQPYLSQLRQFTVCLDGCFV